MGSFCELTIGGRRYSAKVMAFSSNINTNFTSVQVRMRQDHFPIKVGHNDLQMQLIMRDHSELQWFAEYIRRHHMLALGKDAATCSISWPERNMNDWTGFITGVRQGEKMGVTSPTVIIQVSLVDSLSTRRTWTSSSGSPFEELYEGEIPDLPILDPMTNRNSRTQSTSETSGFAKPSTPIDNITGRPLINTDRVNSWNPNRIDITRGR